MRSKKKIQLIQTWNEWFFTHTEYYTESLARSLAYLWPAIAKDELIEVSSQSTIVRLLQKYEVNPNEEIWNYLEVR